jgi:retron-type reverse transcriptase
MNSAVKLLEAVSSFENLHAAFLECSRGKRAKAGYQNFLFRHGEKLKSIEQELHTTGNFRWSGYRDFFVYDPKKRLVMAAPFRDRITHTAIHRIMFPLIDPTLGIRTYACRYNMGNSHAALRLLEQLRLMGKERYCIKLDVRKYFESIPHSVLLKKLSESLPDKSINPLLESLLTSHPRYRDLKRGIPIGNLTSQLFANFYLSSVDRLACEKLNISFAEDKKEKHGHYIRYMDDMIILADTKDQAIDTATALVSHASHDLELSIPPEKFMVLGKDPVPFLGYVMSESGYWPLRRNERRFEKKMKRATSQGATLSLKAQMLQSYESWQELEKIRV